MSYQRNPFISAFKIFLIAFQLIMILLCVVLIIQGALMRANLRSYSKDSGDTVRKQSKWPYASLK